MEEERDDLDNNKLELVDWMLEERRRVRCDKFLTTEITERGIPEKRDDQRSKNKRLYTRKMTSD
jgi:hypothetical protein